MEVYYEFLPRRCSTECTSTSAFASLDRNSGLPWHDIGVPWAVKWTTFRTCSLTDGDFQNTNILGTSQGINEIFVLQIRQVVEGALVRKRLSLLLLDAALRRGSPSGIILK